MGDERAGLVAGARQLQVDLDDTAATALLRLLDELEHWNRAYNLTAITDRAQMLTHHLLDSLSVAPFVQGSTLADVGTGAGFPGLPLALIAPQRRCVLMDSNGKKQRFVAHAARVLGLANVEALQARVEAVRPTQPFDTVVARACAALPQLLAWVAPLCGPHTRVLAMKGRLPDSEMAAVGPPWVIEQVRPLQVPGLNEERHLIIASCRLAA
ncbi:MAG TPA: 16S rRNA (guanine(527)-N(7))-methyltransferase RsmG [Steroidobacteraceae bacterium]|nr:16S rRNA (guanine(527)-N(7))-methyltransferase RsmG [Steroidobacteraceae bacterium]